MQEKIMYGGKEIGIGDEFEVYFHFAPAKGTYIARSDEGIVMLPELGSRMVTEMIIGRWKMVSAKVKLVRIVEKKDGKLFAVLKPLKWSGVYK